MTPSQPPPSSSWLREIGIFLFICLFRLVNTFMVQSYFDPDEFWQTLEPAYCHVFGNHSSNTVILRDFDACPGFTWEWKQRPPVNGDGTTTNWVEQSMLGPARTHLSILPVWLLYVVLKAMEWDTPWWVARGPMCLYALTVAAPTDYAIWYVAKWLPSPPPPVEPEPEPGGQSKNKRASCSAPPTAAERIHRQHNPLKSQGWCLLCSLMSWFGAFSMVRTFSNAQEAALLMLSLALVAPEFVPGKPVVQNDNKDHVQRASLAFFLGGLATSIRFTALAAYIPLGLILTSQQCSSWKQQLWYLLNPCALFGAIGVGVAMIVDRFFYGFWTIPFLANFHFNVILDQAWIYGTHPWYWMFTVALPVVVGLLIPFVVVDFPRAYPDVKGQQGIRNLWLLVASYVISVSFSPHKEFRFLLPVLPIFCLLAGQQVASFCWGIQTIQRYLFLGAMFFVNLYVLAYLGLIHQSGPISVNHWILHDSLERNARTGRTTFSIRYLTGGCHSTPLHSHLHAPPLQFETFALDCSPSCRANPDQSCETERFQSNPARFLEQTVFEQEECAEEDQVCPILETDATSDSKEAADYIVTMSEFVAALGPRLFLMDIHEVARFPHHINGMLFDGMQVGAFNDTNYTHYTVSTWLELSLDELVVFVEK